MSDEKLTVSLEEVCDALDRLVGRGKLVRVVPFRGGAGRSENCYMLA